MPGLRKARGYICRNCFSKIEIIDFPICPECERQAVGGKTHPGCLRRYGLDGLIVACRYKGIARTAIQKVKYKWSYDIAEVLVDLLAVNLWRYNFVQKAVMVPIPLHSRRKKWRGFNQSEILTKSLSKKFKAEYEDFLIRVIETKTQVGLTKEERKKNIRGAFALFRHPELGSGSVIKGKNFILVDDVFTSGATMSEAAGVLKRAGAKSVWGMAVALG
jgi:ComF family protein